MAMTLNELIDAYWDCAYREGKDGRTHDTPSGDAQRIRSHIDAHLSAQAKVRVSDADFECIKDTIRNHHLTYSRDDEGDGYPLIDALSVGHQTVKEGLEEVDLLADAIASALDDSFAARLSQAKVRVTDEDVYNAHCAYHLALYGFPTKSRITLLEQKAMRAALESFAARLSHGMPTINIKCETRSEGITGVRSLNVIRVEPEDDGSFTAVTDHWPSQGTQVSISDALNRLEDMAVAGEQLHGDDVWRFRAPVERIAPHGAQGEAVTRTAADDMRDFGAGFEVDGKRVDPSRVTVYTHPAQVSGNSGELTGASQGEAVGEIRWMGNIPGSGMTEVLWKDGQEPPVGTKLYTHPAERAAVPDGWQPTPANINALPAPIRKYIMMLETEADPAGTIRQNVLVREENEMLRAALAESLATTQPPEGARVVPEGFALVPVEMCISKHALEEISSTCGGYDEAVDIDDRWCEGIAWIGDIEEDDGSKRYGLHIMNADYPEFGSVTLAEFAAPQPPEGARVVDDAWRVEVQEAINLLSETALTGKGHAARNRLERLLAAPTLARKEG